MVSSVFPDSTPKTQDGKLQVQKAGDGSATRQRSLFSFLTFLPAPSEMFHSQRVMSWMRPEKKKQNSGINADKRFHVRKILCILPKGQAGGCFTPGQGWTPRTRFDFSFGENAGSRNSISLFGPPGATLMPQSSDTEVCDTFSSPFKVTPMTRI